MDGWILVLKQGLKSLQESPNLESSFTSRSGDFISKPSPVLSVHGDTCHLLTPGALRRQETLAPLAGQPRPASAGGASHVHPHISDQDQLPQHQADHSGVIMQTSSFSCMDRTETVFTKNSFTATTVCLSAFYYFVIKIVPGMIHPPIYQIFYTRLCSVGQRGYRK